MRQRAAKEAKQSKSRSIQLEQLEPRLMYTVSSLLETIPLVEAARASIKSAQIANKAPTVSQAAQPTNSSGLAANQVALKVLGKDDAGESNLTYKWQLVSGPSGAVTSFSANNSNAAKNSVFTVNKAGNYTLKVTITDKNGLSTASTRKVTFAATTASFGLVGPNNAAVPANGTLDVTTTSVSLKLTSQDQFGNALSKSPSAKWNISTATPGASATIKTNSTGAILTFTKAGDYTVQIVSGKVTSRFTVSVEATLTSISVAPGTSTIAASTTQQFTASGYDQFKTLLARQPSFTWSSTAGSINSSGLFTASSQAGGATITASSSGVTGSATISVTANNAGNLSNSAIAGLVNTYFADGSISRTEMMQLLRSAGVDGSVDASELTDFRYIVSNASQYNIASYVQVLASNVVNTNAANSLYQGATAGNLAAGSTSTLLNNLVDKWFLGTDRPTLTSNTLSYRLAAGSLYVGGPSYLDQHQGALGDCYFIATLGIIAAKNPTAITNMFIDNNDGTYTIRFFTGTYGAYYANDGGISDGFTTGTGVADYITVDKYLPGYSNGAFAYSNAGYMLSSTNVPLWIALAEKAYAQWNATGKSGRNGVNSYGSIEGGWMAAVSSQVLGYNATDYNLATTAKQKLIDALAAGKAVTIGTKSSGSGSLVGSHAYSITGYNATTDQFQLFNPWGSNQPGGLTYAQLQSYCTYFVVADTTVFHASSAANISGLVRGVDESSLFEPLAAEGDDNEMIQAIDYLMTAIDDELDSEAVVFHVATCQDAGSSGDTSDHVEDAAQTALEDLTAIDSFFQELSSSNLA